VQVRCDVDNNEPCTADRRSKVTPGHRYRDNRHQANVRERSRVRSINAAFDGLRARLPPLAPPQLPPRSRTTVDRGKVERRRRRQRRNSPSKLETLRQAVAYIGCLSRLLNSAKPQIPEPPSPQVDLNHCDVVDRVIIKTRATLPTSHYGQSSTFMLAS